MYFYTYQTYYMWQPVNIKREQWYNKALIKWFLWDDSVLTILLSEVVHRTKKKKAAVSLMQCRAPIWTELNTNLCWDEPCLCFISSNRKTPRTTRLSRAAHSSCAAVGQKNPPQKHWQLKTWIEYIFDIYSSHISGLWSMIWRSLVIGWLIDWLIKDRMQFVQKMHQITVLHWHYQINMTLEHKTSHKGNFSKLRCIHHLKAE